MTSILYLSALYKMHAVDSEIESLSRVTKEKGFLFLSQYIFQQVLQFIFVSWMCS